jgi:hypothetical protein
MMANIFTCAGFGDDLFGGCSMAWLGIGVLFFIVALLRKWGGEEMGLPFNFTFGLVGAYVPYLIVIMIFGSFKWALLAGILGIGVIGFGLSILTGGGGEDSGE